jgi:HK97 family phage major capsid protein
MSYTAMLNDLRHKRGNAIDQARQIFDAATNAKRNMTPEEDARFDAFHKEADELRAQIERIEKQMRAEAELEAPTEVRAGKTTGAPENTREESPNYRKAFDAYLRKALLSPELEARTAMSVGTGSTGGYTVPTNLAQEIDVALKAFGGMRASGAEIITTDNGQPLLLPSATDVANVGFIVSENTSISTATPPTFGQVSLPVYMYSSGIALISVQLLQDSAYDMDAFIRNLITTRVGRIQNTHFTTGDGSSKPVGVVGVATTGVTGAAVAAVTTDELYDLKASVDPAYAANGKWMFNNTTLAAIKKLKGTTGYSLWQPGLASGVPDRIDGDPYIINQDMASLGASNVAILYGDFSKYKIRDVKDGITILRLNERYADVGQVAFVALMRSGGTLVDAGTHPVKSYVCAAS